jgi:hypothetical protein
VGQLRLVDNAGAHAVTLDPDSTHLPAIDFHG